MFTIRGRDLVLLILIVPVTLILFAIPFFLKSETDIAQAQGGSNGGLDKNISYAEAMQKNLENHNTNTISGTLLEASPTKNGISPQSDGSGIEVVPISAFRHNGNNANGWFHSFPNGYIRNNSSLPACFMAPTYPPQGATLTQFRFSLVDDSASNDLSVFLQRVRLTTGVVDIIVGSVLPNRDSPLATETFITTFTPGTAVVSNAYAYYITLCFPPNSGFDMLFYGARVFYTP